MEESLIKSFFVKNFGMSAIALAIVATSFFGQVDEERIVGIEKEIVEVKVEIAGLKEDVGRIERKLDDFISSQAASAKTNG